MEKLLYWSSILGFNQHSRRMVCSGIENELPSLVYTSLLPLKKGMADSKNRAIIFRKKDRQFWVFSCRDREIRPVEEEQCAHQYWSNTGATHRGDLWIFTQVEYAYHWQCIIFARRGIDTIPARGTHSTAHELRIQHAKTSTRILSRLGYVHRVNELTWNWHFSSQS